MTIKTMDRVIWLLIILIATSLTLLLTSPVTHIGAHWGRHQESDRFRDAQKILKTAEREMGEGFDQKEYANDTTLKIIPPRILQYVKETGQDPEELTAGYCSGFVAWVLKQNGYMYPRERDRESWQRCVEVTKDPIPGDLVSNLGHISIIYKFIHDYQGRKVTLHIGGAQANRVSILAVYSNRDLQYFRPIKAAKDWLPTPTDEQLKREHDEMMAKYPEPQYFYPEDRVRKP